jgi:hypothetical protein
MKRVWAVLGLALLVLVVPTAVFADGGWVRVAVPTGWYQERLGRWQVPPGNLDFTVQMQYDRCDRVVLTVRDVELVTPSEGPVNILETFLPSEFDPEPGLGRFWQLQPSFALPAGVYEVRVEAFRGDYRFAVDVQYICP